MPPGVQSGFGVHIGPPLLATITVLKSTDTSTNILPKIIYYYLNTKVSHRRSSDAKGKRILTSCGRCVLFIRGCSGIRQNLKFIHPIKPNCAHTPFPFFLFFFKMGEFILLHCPSKHGNRCQNTVCIRKRCSAAVAPGVRLAATFLRGRRAAATLLPGRRAACAERHSHEAVAAH